MIKVLLVDDHDVVRSGLKRIIEEANDIRVVAEGANGSEAFAQFQRCSPDVIILDISMPIMDGLDTTKQILTSCPSARIIILTMHPEHHYATRALKAGAVGYITKKISSHELHEAIRTVATGRRYLSDTAEEAVISNLLNKTRGGDLLDSLSDREFQVLCLLAQGKTAKEIAAELILSIKTIDTYRSRVMEKLDLHNTADIVRFYYQNKLG